MLKLIITLALNKKMLRELKMLTKKVDRLESKLTQLQVAQNARSGQGGFINRGLEEKLAKYFPVDNEDKKIETVEKQLEKRSFFDTVVICFSIFTIFDTPCDKYHFYTRL